MGKINKLTTYAVLWLDSQSTSIEQIILETSLTKKQIQSILDKKSNSDSNTNKIKTTSDQASAKSKVKDLMITESVGRRQNVTIMTKSASEVADEARKNGSVKDTPKSYIWKQQ